MGGPRCIFLQVWALPWKMDGVAAEVSYGDVWGGGEAGAGS